MRSFKVLAVGLSAIVAFTFAACDDQPTEPANQQLSELQASLGNGFPEGGHDFNLHIIGMSHEKTADMDVNNERRIFVLLDGGGDVTNPGARITTSARRVAGTMPTRSTCVTAPAKRAIQRIHVAQRMAIPTTGE